MKLYRVSVLLIACSVMTLFLPLTNLKASPESDTEFVDNEHISMDNKVERALNQLKEFNFTALEKTDSEIKYLHKAFATIFFHNSFADRLIKEWSHQELCLQELLCDWSNKIFEIEEEFLIVLDFLQEVMVEEIELSEEPEESSRNAFASKLINLIKNLRDKYFPDSCYVDQSLASISDFNFYGLKRNDKQLQELHKKLLDFFSRKGMLQDSIICNLSDEAVAKHTTDWDNARNKFKKDKRVQANLKVALFEALEFFEKTVENFKFEKDLLILIQNTRVHMAQRVCQR